MIDLHVHSVYSDGTDKIEDILAKAKKLNLTQIAITDHNNLEGSILAHEMGGIDSVVGTELTTGYGEVEIHLLGYFLNESDYKNVRYIVKENKIRKRIATIETVENLNNMGIDIDVNELSEFTSGTINRVHICKAMMKHGYIQSVQEGFTKYVGDDCPAYVAGERIKLPDAIKAVHDDGGIAVIAHPYEYIKDLDIYEFLETMADSIDGIECFHPSATAEESAKLVEFAKKHNKIITGGSDYHGGNKPNNHLGMMNVDDAFKLKA